MSRSLFTLDLRAIRDNARRLAEIAGGAELWAVVKADGYGHGALDVSRAALEGGASALCVRHARARRSSCGLRVADARLIVLGPVADVELGARGATRSSSSARARSPRAYRCTSSSTPAWAAGDFSELPSPGRDVVGLMSHFASADADPDFTRLQLSRFLGATEPYAHLTRHIANSAGALAIPDARLDAVRCGIALYGISPFADDPERYGLRPALRWESELAHVKLLQPGESTGYGRTFVAERPTWIGIVRVGYADGFRRDMTGTEVLVARRAPPRRRHGLDGRVRGRAGARASVGEEVVILGDGVLAADHARVAGTIPYEIVCGLNT